MYVLSSFKNSIELLHTILTASGSRVQNDPEKCKYTKDIAISLLRVLYSEDIFFIHTFARFFLVFGYLDKAFVERQIVTIITDNSNEMKYSNYKMKTKQLYFY